MTHNPLGDGMTKRNWPKRLADMIAELATLREEVAEHGDHQLAIDVSFIVRRLEALIKKLARRVK